MVLFLKAKENINKVNKANKKTIFFILNYMNKIAVLWQILIIIKQSRFSFLHTRALA